MMSDIKSQQKAKTVRLSSTYLLSFISILLGCLLVLISFTFFDWNPPFTPYSHMPNPFLNGPGVFYDAIHYYGLAASFWIWIPPIMAIVALTLAGVSWLWHPRLLSLVLLPGSIGFLLLTRFALTGEAWDYGNYGYWLTLLGTLVILGGGVWARNALSGEQVIGRYNLVLTCCTLTGSILVIVSFFLPWLALRSDRSNYIFQYDLYLYKGVPVTGTSLASGFFPYIQQFYPQMTPEVFWLLWLMPLAVLVSITIASINLSRHHISYWFKLIIALIPFALFLFPLHSLTERSVTLYGLHITMSALGLPLVSSLLWKETAQKEVESSQGPQRRMLLRRSILGGIVGLVGVAYIGYISWRTSVTQSTLVILPVDEEGGGEAVAWAADGKHLAVTDYNRLRIWDAFKKKQLGSIPFQPTSPPRYYTALAWSPDQHFMAIVTDRSAQVFEVATGRLLSSWVTGTPYIQEGISWSSDSRRVATTAGSNSNAIEIHDATTGKVLQSFGGNPSSGSGRYTAVSWSPDNSYLATSGSGEGDNRRQSFLRIWEVSSNKQIFGTYYAPQQDDARFPGMIAWSPDGRRIATIGDTAGVNVWRAFGEELPLTYSGTGGPFPCFSWSPDSRYIASGDDNVVRVWNTMTGETLFSYLGHQNIIQGVSWSPQSNIIASVSSDGLRVWRPEI